jgi:hypothetical protein
MTISELIKAEVEEVNPKNSVTRALNAYREALKRGLTIAEANAFAEAVFLQLEEGKLPAPINVTLFIATDKGRPIYTIVVDGIKSSSPSLVEILRSIEGLTVRQAKRLVDRISEQNPYTKNALTLEQAQELERRIGEAGGRVSIFPMPERPQ